MKGYPYSFYIPWEKRIFSSTIGNIKPAGPWTSEHNCFSGWHVQTPSSSATGNKSDYHPLQNSSVLSLLIYTLKRQCFISFSNILMIKCTLDKLTRSLRAADSGQTATRQKNWGPVNHWGRKCSGSRKPKFGQGWLKQSRECLSSSSIIALDFELCLRWCCIDNTFYKEESSSSIFLSIEKELVVWRLTTWSNTLDVIALHMADERLGVH